MSSYLKIFGEDFSTPRATKPTAVEADTPTPPPPITASDVDAAYAKGVADGQFTAVAAATRQTQEMVQALLLEIGTVTDAARDVANENALLMTQLLLKLFREFFPLLCANYGPAETSGMVASVLQGLVDEPEVEIRACLAGIAHLEDFLAASPYDGPSKLTLKATDTMPPGDAIMRWKNGRADRNAERTWIGILAALSLHGIVDPEPIPNKTHSLIGHSHG